MKKTLITGLIALSSTAAMANHCMVELQYQGSLLGQNIFEATDCRKAIRECKRTSKILERTVMNVSARSNSSTPFFMQGDLQCVKAQDGMGPGNDGPVVVDPTPAYFGYIGDCHIDDDWSFDPNVYVFDNIQGKSVMELVQKCKDQAQYEGYDTSRVLNIRTQGQVPSDMMVSQCHIDDDWSFDAEEYVTPMLGTSVMEMAQKCTEVEKAYFTNGTSRIYDTQVAPTAMGSLFECHIDDDWSFDYNEYVLNIISADQMQASRECRELQQYYYTNGTSRVRSVRN